MSNAALDLKIGLGGKLRLRGRGIEPGLRGEVRETVISLGKQLSRRWYVGYERGLNATAGSFTLRAQSGFENSLDVIWTWRWG